jgi:hypothetical protein
MGFDDSGRKYTVISERLMAPICGSAPRVSRVNQKYYLSKRPIEGPCSPLHVASMLHLERGFNHV